MKTAYLVRLVTVKMHDLSCTVKSEEDQGLVSINLSVLRVSDTADQIWISRHIKVIYSIIIKTQVSDFIQYE